MTEIDMIGYAAAICVFLTFYMKTMVALRTIALVSNVCFIVYGYLLLAYPILVLHLMLLPVNAIRLSQMLTLITQVTAATQGDLNMQWIRPFGAARNFDAGEVLFKKGDVATEMFFVVAGRFRIRELGIDIGPGQVVGELGLLAHGRARTATVECTEASQVLRISYDHVRQLYLQNPQFGFYFLELTTRRLFENVASLERQLAERVPSGAVNPLTGC
jgi:CRP/FNR family cyclic AMP-dependent transcriptional regulator